MVIGVAELDGNNKYCETHIKTNLNLSIGSMFISSNYNAGIKTRRNHILL